MKDKLNTMDVSFVVESVEEGGVEVTQVASLCKCQASPCFAAGTEL